MRMIVPGFVLRARRLVRVPPHAPRTARQGDGRRSRVKQIRGHLPTGGRGEGSSSCPRRLAFRTYVSTTSATQASDQSGAALHEVLAVVYQQERLLEPQVFLECHD